MHWKYFGKFNHINTCIKSNRCDIDYTIVVYDIEPFLMSADDPYFIYVSSAKWKSYEFEYSIGYEYITRSFTNMNKNSILFIKVICQTVEPLRSSKLQHFAKRSKIHFIMVFCDFISFYSMSLNSNGYFMNLIIFRIVFWLNELKSQCQKAHVFKFVSFLLLSESLVRKKYIIFTLIFWSFCRKMDWSILFLLIFVSRFILWADRFQTCRYSFIWYAFQWRQHDTHFTANDMDKIKKNKHHNIIAVERAKLSFRIF